MLVKHTKRKDPLGVAQYVLGKPGAQVIGGNLNCLDNPYTIANEIRHSCSDSSRLQYNTYHASLAIAPPERLSDDLWHLVANKYLDKMDYNNLPYVAVRHTDEGHDHIHIVAGRFDLDKGKRVPGDWDHYKAEVAARELEAEYGLTPTVSSWHKERKPPTVGMIRNERETGRPAVKPELQDLVDQVSGQVNSLDQFADRLEKAGVELNFKPIGEKTTGLTYGFKDLHFSASQLGRAYTLNGLSKFRGVESPQDSQTVMDWWGQRQGQKLAKVKQTRRKARTLSQAKARTRTKAIAKTKAQARAKTEAKITLMARCYGYRVSLEPRQPTHQASPSNNQAKVQAERQRQAEVQAERQRQAEIEAKRQRRAEIEAKAKAMAEYQDQVNAQRRQQAQAKAERQRREQVEAKRQAEAQPKPQAQPKTQAQPKPQAQPRAQPQAQAEPQGQRREQGLEIERGQSVKQGNGSRSGQTAEVESNRNQDRSQSEPDRSGIDQAQQALKQLEMQQRQAQEEEDKKRKKKWQGQPQPQRRPQRSNQMEL